MVQFLVTTREFFLLQSRGGENVLGSLAEVETVFVIRGWSGICTHSLVVFWCYIHWLHCNSFLSNVSTLFRLETFIVFSGIGRWTWNENRKLCVRRRLCIWRNSDGETEENHVNLRIDWHNWDKSWVPQKCNWDMLLFYHPTWILFQTYWIKK